VRKHIKPGTMLGLIAVLFAMSGTAFAANSLLTGKDIKDGSLTGADVKNKSLSTADLSEKAVKSLRGRNGTNGKDGAPGPAGAKGDTGAAGAKGEQGIPGTAAEQGDPGPQGPAGPAGADGIVNVYFDQDPFASNTEATTEAADPFNDPTKGVVVRDFTLPAGNYAIEAAFSVRGPLDGTPGQHIARVRCNLIVGGVLTDTFYQDFFRPDQPNPGYREGLHIGARVSNLAANTPVSVRCATTRPDGGDAGGKIASGKLEATQVAAFVGR
jgi:uncharacterized protein YjbI with pentapeptide repeats